MNLDIKELSNSNQLLIKISKDKSLTLQHTKVATSCWEVVNKKLIQSFEEYITKELDNVNPINTETDILIQCLVPFDSAYFEGDESNINNWKVKNSPRTLFIILPRKYKKLLLSHENDKGFFTPYYEMNYKLTIDGTIDAVQVVYMKGKTKMFMTVEQLIYNCEMERTPFDSIVEVNRINNLVLDYRMSNIKLIKALKPAGIQRMKEQETKQVTTISNLNLNYIDPSKEQVSKSKYFNGSGYSGITAKRNKYCAQFKVGHDKVWSSSLLESAFHAAIVADAFLWAHQKRIKNFQDRLNFPDNKPCVVCPCPSCSNLKFKSLVELYTPEYRNLLLEEL